MQKSATVLLMCHSSKLYLKFSHWTFAQTVQQTHGTGHWINEHTHAKHIQTSCQRKVNPVKFCFTVYNAPADALSQSYWAISARGSWAWPVKIKDTLMKLTMWEQRGLLSTDGRNPVTLRGETVTVSYWPEWPGSLHELHALFRDKDTDNRLLQDI